MTRETLTSQAPGQAAAHWDAKETNAAYTPIQELEVLLREPGYEHPLETAHWLLLALFENSEERAIEALDRYSALGITWPEGYLQPLNLRGDRPGPLLL